ncbi:ABC multidrug transporter [Colletotrichum truncatum]|uniref:ABC multidrug transporter n=1 Tax=Colletotrichum truncatum TaxID=5467 RepID=A0ACC3YDA3_COLTU|nr:ABC multidrug transporter [Colletotrichum truncatum]KAF6784810.1 ABC multidrug transporter [Colletotrichum truncatum]
MSTDIDRIAAGFELFDVLWAGPVEFAISTYLPYLEIGASCVVSILLATCFVTVCLAIGKMSASAQKELVEAVQRRVSATVSVLSNRKGVKMTGLSRFVDAELQGLRVTELQISRKFRWILTASATISNMSTPALSTATLTVYVLVSRSSTGINLGSALAFTMISLISLLASSVQELSVAIPQMAAAMGCFQRIQKYLMTHSAHRCDRKQAEVSKSLTDNNMEMQCLMVTPDHSNRKGLLLSVNKGDFAFKATTEPTLHNITMQLPDKTWTVLLGPVGSGKSALLLALLGELSLTNGSVYKQPFLQLAYCTQDPWLPNLTLRQVVIGNSNFEHNWYSTVIDACALARDLDELPSGDQTMIGTNGLSLSGGQKQRLSLARALYSRKQLLLLDDILSGLDPATEQRVVERVFGQNGLCRNNGVTVLLAIHSVRHVYRADHAIVKGIGGKILEQGPPRSLSSFKDIGGSAQSNKSDTAIPSGDHTGVIGNASYEHDVLEHDAIQDELSRQAGDMRLYGYYLKAIRWANAIGLVVGDTLYACCLKFPTVLLNWWSVAEAESPGTLTDMYLGIHGMFSLICLISFLLVVILLLHDISLIDMQLLLAFLNSMYLTALCLIEAILIASTSKWSLAIYPEILAVLYVLQKFYLRTSRQLWLLELEAKSPLYSQFSETLKGLVTIRAFGWQQVSVERKYNLLDESQKPYYLLWGIQRWLSLVLDFIVTVLATSIMALATQLGESSAGSLGVSLVSILTFSQNLTYLIRAWVDLETSLGAVARVRSFGRETPCEHLPSECSIPPNEWPRNGVIQVNNLSASYKAGTELVLDGISLAIEKGHKLGICGRTGSGKSSFILSLLKMVEIEHGDIIIDDHSLVAMPRDTLRRRVTVMPQEPLLLSGTIRFNVDPWSENTDNAIISALKGVDLWEAVLRRGVLDTKMDANSMSRGQQQLFCLARALLGRSQVLILDEATSNLDVATQTKMMDIVQMKSASCTVLVVAHHLYTIAAFDRVMVLDRGKLVEWGAPRDLLGRPSIFQELYNSQR